MVMKIGAQVLMRMLIHQQNKENIVALIKTMKGIAPANYESMDRLVSCVQYLEAVLSEFDKKLEEEVTDDG